METINLFGNDIPIHYDDIDRFPDATYINVCGFDYYLTVKSIFFDSPDTYEVHFRSGSIRVVLRIKIYEYERIPLVIEKAVLHNMNKAIIEHLENQSSNN